jgi:hypothetical protein
MNTFDVAQNVWNTHYAIACCDDADVSAWNSDVYKASRRLVLNTLRQVYGLTEYMAQRVYNTLVETGDSVAWCVESVRAGR